jgi:diguanylate cyclase (GGDEF)-like protein
VPRTDDEEGRVRALLRLAVLDTPEEAPFENIVTLVRQILDVPICAVSLVDRQRQWFKARRGLAVCETARDISFCTHALEWAAPFVVQDATSDPRFADNPLVTGSPFIRSYAGIPLRTADGYNVGTLCAIDTRTRAFPAHELAILERFAKMVIGELELRHIAATDELSFALSRRAWLEKAESEILRAQRYDRTVSLAIFDLDRFKLINDTFGHAAGDRVIRRFAELCMSCMRDSDVFGRLGGEEFGLIMPEATAAGMRAFTERVRQGFGAAPIDLGRKVHVTVSIGVAERRPEESLGSLMQRADRALYQSKADGRDRTTVDTAPAQDTARSAA